MFRISHRPETDSTNDDAAQVLGEPEAAGLVLSADYQRTGKGRHARTWVAPPGSSLLCTAILPQTVAADALWAVTFWTGLCVADGIEASTGLRVGLVWPNDVVFDGRKCCGILCVSRVVGGDAWVGCGTGVNVRRPDDESLLAGVEPPPGFLSDRAPGVERSTVLEAILGAYTERLPELRDPEGVARAWELRAALGGTRYRIHVDGDAAPFEAIARRIASGGGLVIDRGGITRTIALADARVLR
jgi:BirA family biotin operon repressor/biotin-[acetyl-CoA-carboxylase] ligase